MKLNRTLMSERLPLLMLVLACLLAVEWSAATAARAGETEDSTLLTYPARESEELLSDDYRVSINGQDVNVYRAEVNDPPIDDRDYGGAYSFVQFDFDGVIRIRIHSDQPIRGAKVRPLSDGIEHHPVNDHTTMIKLKEPRQLIFEPDGENHPLLIFANAFENDRPGKKDKNVTYFGAGLHRPENDKIRLTDGETLYLAGGAVLQAGIEVRGDNVTIQGRGILDGTPWPWRKGPTKTTIDIQDCDNVTIKGIVIRGSSHWTIVPKNSENVTVKNVKICNSRVMNDDGINPCNSRHVRIQDCFIRSDDDCIAIKGLRNEWGNVEDIVIDNTILWVDRARVTLLGHESRAEFMRNITYSDIDIVHCARLPFFLLEPGENMNLQDVTFKDIRINGGGNPHLTVTRPTVNQYMHTKVPGHIRRIRFENITVRGQEGPYKIVVQGRDKEHRAQDILFRNVQIQGETVTADSPRVDIGKWTEDVTFESGEGNGN